jgi:hypothetical protein
MGDSAVTTVGWSFSLKLEPRKRAYGPRTALQLVPRWSTCPITRSISRTICNPTQISEVPSSAGDDPLSRPLQSRGTWAASVVRVSRPRGTGTGWGVPEERAAEHGSAGPTPPTGSARLCGSAAAPRRSDRVAPGWASLTRVTRR